MPAKPREEQARRPLWSVLAAAEAHESRTYQRANTYSQAQIQPEELTLSRKDTRISIEESQTPASIKGEARKLLSNIRQASHTHAIAYPWSSTPAQDACENHSGFDQSTFGQVATSNDANSKRLQAVAPQLNYKRRVMRFVDLEANPGITEALLTSRIEDIEKCQIQSCQNLALAGTCSYRVCFGRGCNRSYCGSHAGEGLVKNAQDLHDFPEDDSYEIAPERMEVCIECEAPMNRNYNISMAILLIFLILLILPCVLLYGTGIKE